MKMPYEKTFSGDTDDCTDSFRLRVELPVMKQPAYEESRFVLLNSHADQAISLVA
jgi:hypothetical protein